MRSAVVIVWVASACGSGTSPPVDVHAVEDCDSSWMANGYTQCEAACVDATIALGAMGSACEATTSDGTVVDCSHTLTFHDAIGCCASDAPRVLFAECN